MTINKEWHQKNTMPKKPTVDQRMQWHIDHLKNCDCYPLSEKLKSELAAWKKSKRF